MTHWPFSRRLRQRGFSLLEMAVTLTILGVLTVALWKFFPSSRDMTGVPPASQLALADEAILGFVMAHYRLPCPADFDGDGKERIAADGTGCVHKVGDFPFSALGIRFPQRLRYAPYQDGATSLTRAIARHKPWLPVLPLDGKTEWPLQGDESFSVVSADTSAISGVRGLLALMGGAIDLIALKNMSTLKDKPKFRRALISTEIQTVNDRINGLDFCAALRDAQDSASTSLRANGVTIAYGLAHPGALDADGDDSFFDGGNRTGAPNVLFAAPGAPATNIYDDHVLAVGFPELAARLSCPAYLSAANAAGHGARAAYDNYRLALAMLQFQAFKLDMAYDSLQNDYVGMAWAIWTIVNDSLSAAMLAFDVAIYIASLSSATTGMVVVKTTSLALKFAVTASKLTASSIKLKTAIEKRNKSLASLDKAKQKRVDAEAYAHSMLILVDRATTRAMDLDKKGLLP